MDDDSLLNDADLGDDAEKIDLEGLDDETKRILDSLMFFLGRNVVAGKEKVDAVHKLRRIAALGNPPSPATIEAYAIRDGKRPKVARQLRTVYEGVLAGKGFRDTSGRLI